MNKILVLYLCLTFCVFKVSAQKRPGYFGRNYFIGWEHSIRPFGSASDILSSQSIGLGKIKVEKLMVRNRVLGLSFEKMKYSIIDGIHPDFPIEVNKQRYLTSRTYSTFLRKYYRARGMAPIGLYIGTSLSYTANSIDTTNNGWNEFSFGDLYAGFELGKTFPLIGNRLIANVSVGVTCSMTYILEFEPIGGSPYTMNNVQSNNNLNGALFGMNCLKANIGISYALF